MVENKRAKWGTTEGERDVGMKKEAKEASIARGVSASGASKIKACYYKGPGNVRCHPRDPLSVRTWPDARNRLHKLPEARDSARSISIIKCISIRGGLTRF